MDVENQEYEPVDIFSMDSSEFENFDMSTLGSEHESTEVDSSEEELDTQVEEQEEEDEFIDVEGADDELDEDETEEEVSEEAEEQEESVESSEDTDINYEEEFKKLIGSPIKANGKDITVSSVEEAHKLMQLGAGYYKNMEALKPARKLIAMLESNSIDEDKLNFAIDLLNKNPQAIHKLISDQDLSEIVDEKNSEYTPKNYGVSEQQLNVTEALKEIEHTETYSRTVNVLGSQWDAQSREIIQKNPQVIGLINGHMSEGIFDAVTAEVERRKMFGSIPHGTPDIIAYKQVGDEMYAQANGQTAPNGQQINPLQANAPKPAIRKPSAETKQKKLATSKPRSKASVTEQMEDVFSMSSAEFKRKFG